MMMDYTGPKETVEDIRKQFEELGYEMEAAELEVHILTGEKFAREIAKGADGMDLLIVGHRKMSWMKSVQTDSIDEAITNLVPCPVLVVNKEVE